MSGPDRAGPRVRLETRAFWRVRASASVTRWVLYATAAVGIIATARLAIAPPRPPAARPAPVAVPDTGAEGFATLFARRYMTWSAASPTAHADGLTAFVNAATDPDLGLGQPARGSQRVVWAGIVQAGIGGPGDHLYTVALDTGAAVLTYLSVDVVRAADGALRLGRYPALVGPPATTPATALDGGGVGAVSDPSLSAVVGRGLRNYLAGSRANLAADLSPGTVVSPPPEALEVDQIEQLRVERDGDVLATLVAHDADGTSFTLTYELDVVRSAGRWLIAAIQTDPRT
ncbi:MAG TPA: conjugal transfer protein [Solirubrobacteraceae bacterium]